MMGEAYICCGYMQKFIYVVMQNESIVTKIENARQFLVKFPSIKFHKDSLSDS
jgi:hypothetical protein